MKRMSRSLPLVLVIASLLALHPLPGAAETSEPGAAPSTPREGELTTETWMGVAAGIGCGFFVRATIVTAGTQVGTIAGAVACCAFMIFDALVIDPALNP